jgi:L-glyceraldehyde 3-phosphate reductase
MSYQPDSNRYQKKMQYRKCGNSGIKLSALSLGLWHNFGDVDVVDNCKAILKTAFDNGITHLSLIHI